MPVASADPMRPLSSIRPAIRSSATASIMPDPQMPVMPDALVASAKPSSSDQRSQPITRKRGSFVTGSISIRSIAPGAARWPALICAPSNAGPVGEEQAKTRVLFPKSNSALVPTSTIKTRSSDLFGSSDKATAAASAPTCPAIHGRM